MDVTLATGRKRAGLTPSDRLLAEALTRRAARVPAALLLRSTREAA
jgi:hypothetical protein